jgi:SAM-dependent methyltransferase
MFKFLSRKKSDDAKPSPSKRAKQEKKWDREFQDYKRTHPKATFAEFYVAMAMDTINSGGNHPTLGAKLNHNRDDRGPDRDFRKIGKPPFKRYKELFADTPDKRVVDYGCGSLRVGVHWIEFLDPGNYMGLDVTRDFIDIGIGLVGEELVAQKKSRFAAISDASVAEAAGLGADLVFSHAVSYHVHPDEFPTYAANLAKIAAKPDAVMAIDAVLAPIHTRYRMRGFAHPLEYYVEAFRPLTFVQTHFQAPITDERSDAVPLEVAVLEFRRK